MDKMIKFLVVWVATILLMLRQHVWRHVKLILLAVARWVVKGLIKFLEELLKRLRFLRR